MYEILRVQYNTYIMRYQFVSICPIKYILDMELQSFPSQDNHQTEALEQIYEEIQREIEGLKLENDILRNYKSRLKAPGGSTVVRYPPKAKRFDIGSFAYYLYPPRLRTNGNCL